MNKKQKKEYMRKYHIKWDKKNPNYAKKYYQKIKPKKKIYNQKRFAKMIRIYHAYEQGKLVWKSV